MPQYNPRMRNEIRKMERIRLELTEELKNQRPQTAQREVHMNDVMQLEIQYESAQLRVEALQEEISKSTQRSAEEIAQLQATLGEKQALIEAYNFKAY